MLRADDPLAYDEARGALRRLSFDLTHTHKPYKPHHNERQPEAALRYAYRANKIERQFRSEIYTVAAEITKLCQGDKNWLENEDILALWHGLALQVKKFSEHPEKKVACLILSREGRLLAFAANRAPDDMPKSQKAYKEGIRRRFILCAEKLSTGELTNNAINFSNFRRRHKLNSRAFKNLIPVVISRFNEQLITSGMQSNDLHDLVYITTTIACSSCKQTLGAMNLHAVLSDIHSGKNFKRAQELTTTIDRTEKGRPPMEIKPLPTAYFV